MESGAGNDWLKGGAGEDTYVLGKTDTGVDTIYDNDGKDHLEYEGPNTDMIYSGIGDDWLWGASDDDQWQRHNGQSHQRGDWISGEAGSDHIYGSSAKDVLFGGAGSDDIKGGAGDDLILGDVQYSVASRVMAQSYAGRRHAQLQLECGHARVSAGPHRRRLRHEPRCGPQWPHPRVGLASRAARNGLPLHPGRGYQLHAAARSRR